MAKALNMDGSDINGKVNKKIISKTLGKVTGKTTGKVWDYGEARWAAAKRWEKS